MNGRDPAGASRERVLARLASAGAKRRDAVDRALRAPRELPSYDDVEETTGRFAAIAADAAASATAKAVARASRPEIESLPPLVRRTKRWGRAAAALAVAGTGFVALAKWVLKLF